MSDNLMIFFFFFAILALTGQKNHIVTKTWTSKVEWDQQIKTHKLVVLCWTEIPINNDDEHDEDEDYFIFIFLINFDNE